MDNNFDNMIKPENINNFKIFKELPYPIKISEYSIPTNIDLTFPLYNGSEFTTMLMIFKLWINKNTTNKDAYEILLDLIDKCRTISINQSIYDQYIIDNVLDSLKPFNKDKLVFDKDNDYLEFVISIFISGFIDFGLVGPEFESEENENYEHFTTLLHSMKLFTFNVYMATMMAIFTNDYDNINMNDFFKKYNITDSNKLSVDEIKSSINLYECFNTITEINMFLVHTLYGNIMRHFYAFLSLEYNFNKNNKSDLYKFINKSIRGKKIFKLFQENKVNKEHFDTFELIVLNFKKNNLCKDIGQYVQSCFIKNNSLAN